MSTITLANGDVYTLTEDHDTTHQGKPVRIRAFAKTKTARSQKAHEFWLHNSDPVEAAAIAKGRYLLIQEQSGDYRTFTYGSKIVSVEMGPQGVECIECGEFVEEDGHGGYGMCSSCVHNARRSGWTPGDDE